MTRICPICGTHSDGAALNCECGEDFSDKVASLQPDLWVEPSRYRRRRSLNKAGALIGSGAIILFFAAYFGGVFPMRGKPDIEEEASQTTEPAAIISSQPPAASNHILPEANGQYRLFPEANVEYKATRAITGSVIAVTDAYGQERRVTLFGLRVPKLDENFGVESKERLWMLIANKPLLIKRRKFTKEVDTIAEVTVEGSNLNLEQLRGGLALPAPEDVAGLPAPEQQQYLAAAQSARNGKQGMWSGKHSELAQAGSTLETSVRNDSMSAEPKRSRERNQRSSSGFDFPDFVEQSADPVVPPVTVPDEIKEQAPTADAPVSVKDNAPPEGQRVVGSPPVTGRKYVRGPFGGCFYINSSGNKSYVDRSKCE